MFDFLLFDGAKLHGIRRLTKKKHFARLAKPEKTCWLAVGIICSLLPATICRMSAFARSIQEVRM